MLTRVPIVWRVATVRETIDETPRARTLVLDVPGWPAHTAGMHADVRLTAEDGYQAQRSYSIASPPESPTLDLTVELIDDGEVSPYFVQEVRAGDVFEVRGPIGGHFAWSVEDGGPLLLVAGGSGLVPLMAMLRHRAARHSDVDTRLLVSTRYIEDVLFAGELAPLGDTPGTAIHHTLTRGSPLDWTGFTRRVDGEMLAAIGPAPEHAPRIFVCGPTGFVEQAADALVALGHDPSAIHGERFGPTGT